MNRATQPLSDGLAAKLRAGIGTSLTSITAGSYFGSKHVSPEHDQESGPLDAGTGETPKAAPKSSEGRGLENFSPTGLLGFCMGDRYNLGHDRTFEWRDALGCVWLPVLGAILSVAIWLGQIGVPIVPLQIGTVVALVGAGIALWRLGRSRRSD